MTNYQPFQLRQVKLDLPKFDGTEPLNWLFRAEQFFAYYDTPDAQRVTIAAVHMEGTAVPWFQLMQKNKLIPDWSTLARAIEDQFDPSKFENPRSQMFKLTQTDSAAGFYQRFMVLANQVEWMTEDAIMDCFISGLKPDVQRDVIAKTPTSLIEAAALARLYDEKQSLAMPSRVRGNFSPVIPSKSIASISTNIAASNTGVPPPNVSKSLPPFLPTPSMKPSSPIKKLSQAEMLLRREKGLCFTCDDKFTPSHRCPNRHYMIHQCEEDDVIEEPNATNDNETKVEDENTLHHLSFHAFQGSYGPATIRFEGINKELRVQIFLDGGSSDNIVQPRVVQYLKLPVEPTP